MNSPLPSQTDAIEADHISLGRLGEAYAAAYLEHAGYRIVAANMTLPVGRNLRDVTINAEIDLVAYEGETLCFIEVKTRRSDWFAPPQANVDRRKRRQVARAARTYRRMFALENAPYRFDVVTVVVPADQEPQHSVQLELFRSFWTEDKLRKRRWEERYYD